MDVSFAWENCNKNMTPFTYLPKIKLYLKHEVPDVSPTT